MLCTATAATRGPVIGIRQRVPELMDEPGIDPEALDHALRGIARINAFSLTAGHLWRRLHRIALERRLTRLRILDVGCGNADVTLGIARRARCSGMNVELFGCDQTEVAVDAARELARRAGLQQVRFFQANVLADDLQGTYDAVISSLFLHHLDESDSIALLHRLRGVARHAIVMDDLCRSALGYWLARWGCQVLTRSPVVHFDGPASVRSALTAAEALALAHAAGLEGAIVKRRWPERFTLIWKNNVVSVPEFVQ
ncbi:methyltransferase domain-containing protein [Lacipirellula parvula]|uniref:Serine/threonine protein kinase n=1 Tax=Lacipirellula parvula TaxID=2650471 RepID=A0A5K7XA47_9BACT|nr:methyltransferase domain-containing protein [Lacipirellula parvula]BBO33428.1 serine/threonine protein kinase [Lacipirellula parvula]